jgi:phospholipase C
MVDLLGQANVSWKYYNGYDPEIENFRNPLSGFKEFINSAALRSHLVHDTEFYRDIQEGQLPQVSWIVPNIKLSEHPPLNIKNECGM